MFTENDKFKALAIVNIFETSRPFGDYAACVVLNDGAGISYGINQFTHRSGSLAAVVDTYLKKGGRIGSDVFTTALPLLKSSTAAAILRLSKDDRLKKALRSAAVTREMKEAQKETVYKRYLQPALRICEAHGFVTPLSLAVIYDSVIHGSFERIANSVSADGHAERAWITEYVRKRHFWLTNVKRLTVTNYRTKFFLDQLAIGNWNLRLPLNVHGHRLTEKSFSTLSEAIKDSSTVTNPAKPAFQIEENHASDPNTSAVTSGELPHWDGLRAAYGSAVEKFDRVEGVLTGVVTRTDSAKSLWTTVGGTLWQAAWAIFGFIFGLPKTVWVVVAVIAAALMLLYLYRQIALGKIREIGPANNPSSAPNTAETAAISKAPTQPFSNNQIAEIGNKSAPTADY